MWDAENGKKANNPKRYNKLNILFCFRGEPKGKNNDLRTTITEDVHSTRSQNDQKSRTAEEKENSMAQTEIISFVGHGKREKSKQSEDG